MLAVITIYDKFGNISQTSSLTIYIYIYIYCFSTQYASSPNFAIVPQATEFYQTHSNSHSTMLCPITSIMLEVHCPVTSTMHPMEHPSGALLPTPTPPVVILQPCPESCGWAEWVARGCAFHDHKQLAGRSRTPRRMHRQPLPQQAYELGSRVPDRHLHKKL